MKILQQLSEYAHAHGYARQTGDLDLLVSNEDLEFWIKLLKDFHYSEFQLHDVFARFMPSHVAEWPIALMFVDNLVFDQLFAESILADFSSLQVHIPSKNHMIALKLHALKQRQSHREEKDLGDVRQLLKLHPMSQSDLRQLCEKYDRLDLYEALKRNCR